MEPRLSDAADNIYRDHIKRLNLITMGPRKTEYINLIFKLQPFVMGPIWSQKAD